MGEIKISLKDPGLARTKPGFLQKEKKTNKNLQPTRKIDIFWMDEQSSFLYSFNVAQCRF